MKCISRFIYWLICFSIVENVLEYGPLFLANGVYSLLGAVVLFPQFEFRVVNNSNDDGMLDAMNEQNEIMKRQLRIQRQQNIRQVMKRNQCILNNLNTWYKTC